MAFNDYGFELLSPTRYEIDADVLRQMLSPIAAEKDILSSINARSSRAATFVRSRGSPASCSRVTRRQPQREALQVTSGLLFDVYARHDPTNPCCPGTA